MSACSPKEPLVASSVFRLFLWATWFAIATQDRPAMTRPGARRGHYGESGSLRLDLVKCGLQPAQVHINTARSAD